MIMAISTIFALFMAYGIGANDAANSWATCVGSNAISLKKAVLLCGFFEWLGATCLGSGVSFPVAHTGATQVRRLPLVSLVVMQFTDISGKSK